MEMNFRGKRALVTGAAGGIGSVLVEKLVECGADVVALDNNPQALDSLKKKIPGIQTLCVDLCDWEATRRAGEESQPIDMLVNCAGILLPVQKVGEIQESDFDRIIGVNIKAALNLSQTIASGMKERGTGGAIVNVSSLTSTRAFKGGTTYATSKAALDMVTKSFALELGPHQIRVNAVNPTAVNTEMLRTWQSQAANVETSKRGIPLGRIAEPVDVADAVLYLLSDKAAMINGATLPVDGGATVT